MARRLITILMLVGWVLAAGAEVPSQVKSRLNKIDGYMTRVESALQSGKADHNNLDRAKETYDEIVKGYPDHAGAPEVRAAAERIRKGEEAIRALESKQAEDGAASAKAEQSADALAEDWAKKLDAYKADTKPGSLGEFGVPSMDVDHILRMQPRYLEAKKLYDEFLATKIDPDSHWMLRQAEYDIRVALQNYLQSITNVHDEIAANIRQAQTWIAGQKGKTPPLIHGSGRMEDMTDQMSRLRRLLPKDDSRLVELEGVWAKLIADQNALELVVLKNRRMKADAYKGADAATVKALAAKIVMEDRERRYADQAVKPVIKVLRTHITSASWDTEAAVEWTDSTKSALQYRVSKGLFVQVACQVGESYFVYTLYVHRDKIGGETGALMGHVMYRDKFLKENLPK